MPAKPLTVYCDASEKLGISGILLPFFFFFLLVYFYYCCCLVGWLVLIGSHYAALAGLETAMKTRLASNSDSRIKGLGHHTQVSSGYFYCRHNIRATLKKH